MNDSRPGARPPLRVLHIVTRYAGGSVRRVVDVVGAVDAEHTVVVGPDSDPLRLAELDGRARVELAPHLVRAASARADPRAFAELLRLVRQVRPHVVHTHQSKGGLLGRVAARVAGVRIVYHSASMASFGPGYGRVESGAFRVAEWLSSPLVTRYFVVGRDLAVRLERDARVPARKLTTVRSSIPAERFPRRDPAEQARCRRALGIDDEVPVVAFVGILEPRKGVDDLPALVRAATGGRPAVLLVAGDGPLREALGSSVVPDVEVRVLGQVGDVAEVMAAADAVVLPSTAEGLPQVLVQAAMVGVPFAAYEVDGVPELLGLGAPGRSAPVLDRAGLVAALAEVLSGGRRCGPGAPPPGLEVWGEWEPAAVAARYRAQYERDVDPG